MLDREMNLADYLSIYKITNFMNIFKFWIYLENQPPDSIAKLCLNILDKIAQESKSCLMNKINLSCTQLHINKQSVNFKYPYTFLSKAVNNLSKHLNLIRARENELRERIPHTCPTSHENYF